MEDATEINEYFSKRDDIKNLIISTELNTVDTPLLADIYKRIEKEYLTRQLGIFRIKLAASEEKRDTTRINDLLEKISRITNRLKGYKT